MGAFKFRLQQVIPLRTRERDAAAGAYRDAVAAVEILEKQIVDLQAEIESQKSIQSDALTGIVDSQRLLESQRYAMTVDRQIADIRSKLTLVETEREKRRQFMVTKEQALKSIENLRDKQRQLWIEEQSRIEQLALDEWAATKHWSGSRENGNSEKGKTEP